MKASTGSLSPLRLFRQQSLHPGSHNSAWGVWDVLTFWWPLETLRQGAYWLSAMIYDGKDRAERRRKGFGGATHTHFWPQISFFFSTQQETIYTDYITATCCSTSLEFVSEFDKQTNNFLSLCSYPDSYVITECTASCFSQCLRCGACCNILYIWRWKTANKSRQKLKSRHIRVDTEWKTNV